MKDFEVLVVRGTNPSGVSMTRDILAAAAVFAERQGESVPTWGFHSPGGGRVELQGGIGIETRKLPGRRKGSASILLVPGIWVVDARQLAARLAEDDCQQAIRAIAAHVAGGGEVAARGPPVREARPSAGAGGRVRLRRGLRRDDYHARRPGQ